MLARLVLGSLRSRRSRVLLALLAVTLGTGVATALGTLALQVGDDLARTLRASGPNFVLRPEGAAWRPEAVGEAHILRAGVALPESAAAALKSTFWRNNVLEAAPELDVDARLGGRAVTLTGTWFARDIAIEGGTWRTGLASLRPRWTVEGAWPAEDRPEVVLGAQLAGALATKLGQVIVVSADGREARVRVTGIVRAGGLDDRRAWLPLAIAQRIAERPGQVDRVALSALVRPAPRHAPPDPARDPVAFERWM
jgi:putative ABC transport system permease protein